ncbi:MAG: hypothetical protein RLZZ312_1451 [Bacteroidota bacterium]|jgi:hypothetical protein
MILYNVTCNIQERIEQTWLDWMTKKHIPEILATGKFSSARLVKVLVEEELGGVTYAVQYKTDSRETLQQYYDDDAQAFRAEGLKLFGDAILAFRTELEVIQDFYLEN